MGNDLPSVAWFALRTKSNRERVTAAGLEGRGYEVFLPEYKPNGTRAAPLFPGYLFSRFNFHNRLPVLSLPGVVHIVGIGRMPAPVDEDELASLRILVDAGIPVQPEPEVKVGQAIRIARGPLAGAAGIVAGVSGERLAVRISLLQRAVSVELDGSWIDAEPAPVRAARAGEG